LDNGGTIDLDNGKQIRAYRQHRIYFPGPFLIEFQNRSSCEIECEELCELLTMERAGSRCDTLKHAVGQFPVCLLDLSQGAAINLTGSLW
jgi:hypothetical protein